MFNCYLFIQSSNLSGPFGYSLPFDSAAIHTSCSLEYLAIISLFRSGDRGRPLVHWNSPFHSTWGDHRQNLARVTYRRYDI